MKGPPPLNEIPSFISPLPYKGETPESIKLRIEVSKAQPAGHVFWYRGPSSPWFNKQFVKVRDIGEKMEVKNNGKVRRFHVKHMVSESQENAWEVVEALRGAIRLPF